MEKEAPVLRERLRHQDAEIKKRDTQIGEFRSKFDEQGALIRELLETSKAAETRGYTRAKDDIETRRKEAVANADVEAFQAAERALELLDLTIASPNLALARRRELLRLRESLCAELIEGNQQTQNLSNYFNQFALLARRTM